MWLDELAAAYPSRPARQAPSWMLGCFRRRSITFYTGETDTTTEVWWLQTCGMSFDLRLQPGRPNPTGRRFPDECTPEELTALANAEGGMADTDWDGALMSWGNWTSFQLHDKWAEPAGLRRVGDCVIEFAPSGAYVEDWRLQHTLPGPLIGLRMLDERNSDTGEVLYRGGGLIVCGNHAALVRGRRRGVEANGRLAEVVRSNVSDRELIRSIFRFEASYGVRATVDALFAVHLSTNPQREGRSLLAVDGFEFDSKTELVTQHVWEEGVPRTRTFTVDTLQPLFPFAVETSVSPGGGAWLQRESDTLLAFAHA